MAKSSSGAEFEHHLVAVRHRIIGSGNLKLTAESLQAVRTLNLLDLPITNPAEYEPIRLANFQSQRIRLVGGVTNAGDWFEIKRLIFYIKPVAIERPILT